jgi:LacI family transcriptional regulator
MEELGYRPNALARSLRRHETLTIGVVVHDITNPFFTSMVKCVEAIAGQAGYSVILCNSGEDPRRFTSMVEVLLAKRVDGLIVAPVNLEDLALAQAERHGTPIVYLGPSPTGTTGPFIRDDALAAATAAVQHLVDDGHKRIAVIAGRLKVPALTERMSAYCQVLKQCGLPYDDDLVKAENDGFDDAARSMRDLLRLSDRPTAVFSTNFLMTTGALSVLRDEQVECPKDMGLVGVDDHVWIRLFQPPLTMVRTNTEEVGVVAADLLLTCMKGKAVETREIVLPAELVVRGSCSERCLQKLLASKKPESAHSPATGARAEPGKPEEVMNRV